MNNERFHELIRSSLLDSVWAVEVALVPVLASFHSILGVFVVTDKNYGDSILS